MDKENKNACNNFILRDLPTVSISRGHVIQRIPSL